jgi:hypothetical protein
MRFRTKKPCGDPGFTTSQFGKLVKELKKNSTTELKEVQKIADENYWLNIPITQASRVMMVELCKLNSVEPSQIVNEAIKMFYDYSMGNWKDD